MNGRGEYMLLEEVEALLDETIWHLRTNRKKRKILDKTTHVFCLQRKVYYEESEQASRNWTTAEQKHRSTLKIYGEAISLHLFKPVRKGLLKNSEGI